MPQYFNKAMKKRKSLEGTLESIPCNKIYLNINHLVDGTYVLKILYKNKVIQEITFKKES